MAFTYAEFNTTPANLVADLKAKILASSDYTNPTGNVVLATTPLGAKIAVNLSDAAPTTQVCGFAPYRTFSGVSGTDLMQGRYIWYKRNNTGSTTTNPLHVRVSAGSTLLYVDIEGPYSSEPNTDSVNYGSFRQMFAVGQITPYFTTSPSDAIPSVALMGSTSYNGYSSNSPSVNSHLTHVSRNMADNASWVEAHLEGLGFPNYGYGTQTAGSAFNRQATGADGNSYLSPYVISEHIAGMRGRLTDLFFAGWKNPSAINSTDPGSGLFEGNIVTYGGNTYKVLAPFKSDLSSSVSSGSVGACPNSNTLTSVLVAVRTA